MVEAARLAHVRDEEVEPAIVVIVAPGRALGAALVRDAGCVRDVFERAVALVVVEPAAIPGIARVASRGAAGREIFAADEEVDEAVVVVIAPGGRLGRDRLGQAAGEPSRPRRRRPVVAQQRQPQRLLPAAAQQQDVEIAVVVEIRPSGSSDA